MKLAAIFALIWVSTVSAAAMSSPPRRATPIPACGMSPGDWCPAPRGDRCGRHRTAQACRADKLCYGMPYLGESVVACITDQRGFATNCPVVGCTGTPPRKSGR